MAAFEGPLLLYCETIRLIVYICMEVVVVVVVVVAVVVAVVEQAIVSSCSSSSRGRSSGTFQCSRRDS